MHNIIFEQGTSKANSNMAIYGKHGEALNYIAALSHMEITSRTKAFCACRKIFLNEKSIIDKIMSSKHHIGTTVKCSNFFFNTPVRRLENATKRQAQEMQDLRKCIEEIVVVHPNITFSVHIQNFHTKVYSIVNDSISRFKQVILEYAPTLANKELIQFSFEKLKTKGFLMDPKIANTYSVCLIYQPSIS